MGVRWAWRISAVFHPLFLNYAGLLLLLFALPALRGSYTGLGLMYITGMYFLNTVLLPLLLILLLKYQGVISSLEMRDRQERKLPLLLMSVFYISAFYFFKQHGFHPALLSYLLASASVVIFTSLANQFFKISLHLVSVGAIIGLFVALHGNSPVDLRLLLAVFILCAGLVTTARIALAAHTKSELVSGFFLGFIIMAFIAA